MGFRITTEQSEVDGVPTTVATAALDASDHVYATVTVEGPIPDWFERNAVRITLDENISTEVTEGASAGRAVLSMVDPTGRALAAALTAHYQRRDEGGRG